RETPRVKHFGCLGASVLEFRMGERALALGHLGRTCHADCALVPTALLAELEGHLEASRPELRCHHYASWFAMAAHQRRYARAGSLASDLTRRPLRSNVDLVRTVVNVLCCGRTHLDHALPSGFWAGLHSNRLDPGLIDAVAILSELFARMRVMSLPEIEDRLAVARQALSTCGGRGPGSKVGRLVDLLRVRAVAGHAYFASIDHAGPGASLEDVDATLDLDADGLPSYFLGGLHFARQKIRELVGSPAGDSRAVARELIAASGMPVDLVVQTNSLVDWLVLRHMWLVAAQTADEVVLFISLADSDTMIQRTFWGLRALAGREWLATANLLVTSAGRSLKGSARVRGLEAAVTSASLAADGELGEAWECVKTALADVHDQPFHLPGLLLCQMRLSRQSFLWDRLEDVQRLLALHRRRLRPSVVAALHAYLDGCLAMRHLQFDLAADRFGSAMEEAASSRTEAGPWIQRWARCDMLLCRGLARRVREARRAPSRPRHWLRALRGFAGPLTSSFRTEGPVRSRLRNRLDYLVLACEALARSGALEDADDVLACTMILLENVEPSLRSAGQALHEVLAANCPTFAKRLRSAARELPSTFGGPSSDRCTTRMALSAARDFAPGAAPVAFGLEDWRRCERRPHRFPLGRSERRRARVLGRTWGGDGARYRLIRGKLEPAEEHGRGAVTVDQYGYIRRAAPAVSSNRIELAWVPLFTPRGGLGGYLLTDIQDNRTLSRDPARLPFDGAAARRGGEGPLPGDEGASLGSSRAAAALSEQIGAAAGCDYPILITGPTGAGKEHVARLIHRLSKRGKGELVVADCAAATETLLESELFGHVKGAFTGAIRNHEGLFARAHGSTLLLDEVDSMTPRMQSALLRVLETGEFRPLGDGVTRWSDFRVLSLALPQLDAMVAYGRFREDLYYRISTIRIHVPALRDRGDDGVELARAHARALGKELTPACGDVIRSCEWPGNVRQMYHCLDVAAFHSPGAWIGEQHLREAIGRGGGGGGRGAGEGPGGGRRDLRTEAVEEFRDGKPFVARDYARAACVSQRSAQRHLARLVRLGAVARTGAGRSVHYRVVPLPVRGRHA
ncbi:MAG: sigma-54-dependent transcriptional regulator, partial [Planctomycetota bacterium]